MANTRNSSLMIGYVITFLGFIIFFIPFEGAQRAAYGLFLLAGLLYAFLLEENISRTYRGKAGWLVLLKEVFKNATPPLFVMVQAGLLFSIFSNYSSVMEEKDASGNLPGILVTYNYTSFAIMMVEMVFLGIYAGKIIRGGFHPNPLIKMIEAMMIPAFIALGTLGIFYTGLLYTVITHYLTDG